MVKIVLYDFKTAKEAWYDELLTVYQKKLKPFCQFEIQHLKTIHTEREDKLLKIKHEEKILLEKLSNDDFVILFDVLGKAQTSEQFAETLQKFQISGKKRLVFVVGGAYGVGDSVKAASHLKLTLGSMTMNHLIAEAVILEQIYRGFTILNRIPYHNA